MKILKEMSIYDLQDYSKTLGEKIKDCQRKDPSLPDNPMKFRAELSRKINIKANTIEKIAQEQKKNSEALAEFVNNLKNKSLSVAEFQKRTDAYRAKADFNCETSTRLEKEVQEIHSKLESDRVSEYWMNYLALCESRKDVEGRIKEIRYGKFVEENYEELAETNEVEQISPPLEETTKEQKEQEVPTLKLSGVEQHKTPFGKPTPVPFNHLENINRFPGWKNEFCKKNNLEITKNENNILEFISLDKKEKITLDREGVSASIPGHDTARLFSLMAELFLKSCEGRTVTNYLAKCEDQTFQEKLEQELMRQLQEKGINDVIINGKELKDFTNSYGLKNPSEFRACHLRCVSSREKN